MVGPRRVRLQLVRHRRARRYVLRLGPDGSARVTIPRGGSVSEAKRFASKHVPWLEKQLLRQAARAAAPRGWQVGTEVLFRGESVRIEVVAGTSNVLRVGENTFAVADPGQDLRPELERHFWKL